MINKLTVFYDPHCGFCVNCALWLESQTQIIALELLATGSEEARRRYPQVTFDDDLTVISDCGGIYRGADAWIMTLYALAEYRTWSYRFTSPLLKPLARNAFELLSKNRRALSNLLGLHEYDIHRQLSEVPGPTCEVNAI